MRERNLFRLCEAQEGLWYAQALDPENPLFNTGQFIELTGPLDVAAFARAHAAAMAEAEALRLRFTTENGVPEQSLSGPVPQLEIVDLRDDPAPFRRARSLMDKDSFTPVDPAKDPLAAFSLFLLSETHYLWYERIHHLAIDGFGMVLLTNRVAALYGAELGRNPGIALAPFDLAFEADAAYRASDQWQQDAAFWHDYCRNPGRPASPSGQAAIVTHSGAHRFIRQARNLPAEVFARLQEYSTRLKLGWPDVLTLLSSAYLRRIAPDGEAIHGLPYMARFGSKAARVPCMWMNVLPYRLAIAEDEALDAALIREAAALGRLRKSGRYRSETLRRDLGRMRAEDRLYGPLINVQPYDVAPRFHGLDSHLHILGAGPVDDLTISYRGDGKQAMIVEIDASPALYSADGVAAHLDRLVAFLERAIGAGHLSEVPTVTGAEHRRLIFDLNDTAHAVPDTTLTALIEAQMMATPDAPAVVFGDRVLSYADLDRRSRALAERLTDMGAGPERLVAVALERSEHLAIALVAILRAGAAYVPLDPDQPAERLAGLVARTEPVALLAGAELGGTGISSLPPKDWPEQPQGRDLPRPRPDNLAYVLFTSGSTGAPKGVMIEHRAIVNRLIWMRDHYGFSPDDRILQKTPVTFDVSVWELFLPCLCGGTLIFAAAGAHRDPAAIAAAIREHAVTVLHFVPSMLAAFLDHPASEDLALRQVFCSGEALTAEHRDRFHARIASELHNLYGPTEAAVDVTFWDAGRDDRTVPLPIGMPVWNTCCYVLDSALRPVPDSVSGELYLGGRQLARGYLGRDDLTAERFRPDPFRPGERIYATGDLVRRQADGAIIYLDRNDHQVKIRGMRVEPGEIEHALRALPDLRDAVVLARDDLGPGVQLVAYLLSAAAIDTQAIATALSANLPAHMVPAYFIAMTEFPITANGKLDRKALPRPESRRETGTPPQSAMERIVAEQFRQTLTLADMPTRETNFFTTGDSLAALRLLLALEEKIGRAVPLGQLFETPGVAALAHALEMRRDASAGLTPRFPLAEGRAGIAPLILLHPAGGLCWGYRGVAQAMTDRTGCPVIGLQSPVLSGGEIPGSITALCRDYADLIESWTDSPQVHIAGWSLGGILAQELAVELTGRGRRMGAVALLDAYPAECWRAEPVPDSATSLRALLAIAGHDPEAHPELDTREKVVAFLKRQSSLLGALPAEALDAVVRLVSGANALMRSHEHRSHDGALLHIRAAHDHQERGFTSELWAPHCTRLDRLALPCLHKDMIAPAQVGRIADAIAERF